MLKLFALVLGLAAGFALGNWWAVHNPVQASALAAQEERQFLEAQVKISQAVKQKLDQLAGRQQSPGGGVPGSGFVSASAAPIAPEDINSLRNDEDRQLQQMQQRLAQLKQ